MEEAGYLLLVPIAIFALLAVAGIIHRLGWRPFRGRRRSDDEE
jgi:hypothetical protein